MLGFAQSNLIRALDECDDALLDQLDFGVVALSRDGAVLSYNQAESRLSGLSPERVRGRGYFADVAPCLNNFMVAQRFLDEERLDVTLPYVFTLRMRPRPVELRLLKEPDARRMYVLVRPR